MGSWKVLEKSWNFFVTKIVGTLLRRTSLDTHVDQSLQRTLHRQKANMERAVGYFSRNVLNLCKTRPLFNRSQTTREQTCFMLLSATNPLTRYVHHIVYTELSSCRNSPASVCKDLLWPARRRHASTRITRMTEVDLPSLQLQSISHLNLGWRDDVSRFFALVTSTLTDTNLT